MPHRLSQMLHELVTPHAEAAPAAIEGTAPEQVKLTIGEALDRLAQGGVGVIIALVALVSLPFVGLSTPFGLVIMFAGLQLAVQRRALWMPRWVRRLALPTRHVAKLARGLGRLAAKVGRAVRPRWAVLLSGPGRVLIGLGVVLLGFGLALPLPIPGSNWSFLAPILLYATGLLERDGVLVTLGHAFSVGYVALGIAFADAISSAVSALFA